MKHGVRIAGLALALCLLLSLLPMAALAAPAVPDTDWRDYAADSFAGGTGTQEDPYLIATAEQLAKLAKDVNSEQKIEYAGKFFRLENDLDLSAHRWNPIGTYTIFEDWSTMNRSFRGFLDGNGKTITGMIVDECAEQNCGILVGFVMTNDGCAVQISDVTVSGKITADCIAGNLICGGMIGQASRVKATDCTVRNVEINGNGGNSGGFVGMDGGSEYVRCTASGKVSGQWAMGGFVGYTTTSWWQHAEGGSKMSYCFADVQVEGSDWRVGGFAGLAEYAQISHCVSLGKVISTVTGWEPKVGGFAGEVALTKITNSHMAGAVSSASKNYEAGGFLGSDRTWPSDFDYENDPDVMKSTVENCSYDREKNPTLKALGMSNNALEGTAAAGTTKEVLFNICEDYYESHQWGNELIVDEEPTCTEPGVKSFHCERCGASGEKVLIDPKGHDLEKVEEQPATCTEDGHKAYWVCKVCEKLFADENGKEQIREPIVIPAAGHTLEKTEEQPAACLEDGHEAYWTCKVCKKLFADEQAQKPIDAPVVLKATGHSFGAWKITKPATATEDGEKERVCTVCRFKETEKIPATGETTPEKPATPKTGDESNVSAWIVVPIVCACVIVGLVIVMVLAKKKSKKD